MYKKKRLNYLLTRKLKCFYFMSKLIYIILVFFFCHVLKALRVFSLTSAGGRLFQCSITKTLQLKIFLHMLLHLIPFSFIPLFLVVECLSNMKKLLRVMLSRLFIILKTSSRSPQILCFCRKIVLDLSFFIWVISGWWNLFFLLFVFILDLHHLYKVCWPEQVWGQTRVL